MSLSFTLPEASRSLASAASKSWPAPSETAMTRVRFGEHPLLQCGEKCFELEGHLRDEREIHVLACDGGASRDEPSVATHEFHETNAAGHAACLGMRAIEHARGFFDGAEESECARDEANVVVDGLRHADDGERVAAAARFLVEIVRAALRAIAPNGEEDVYAARDEVVHRGTDVHGAPRRAEDRAALFDECHPQTAA